MITMIIILILILILIHTIPKYTSAKIDNGMSLLHTYTEHTVFEQKISLMDNTSINIY